MTDLTAPPAPPKPPEPPPRSSATRVLLVLTGVALVVFLVATAALFWLVSRVDRGTVAHGSFLEVTLDAALRDAAGQPSLFQDPERMPPTVPELAASIRRAAGDDRITGLYLQLDGASGGWASFQELRSAVTDFRASGKPCVAYAPSMITNHGYYLATACPTVAIGPASAMFVNGLSMEVSYFKGLFDKLGVNPEFEHVGDFKSFIEAYERTGPSPAAATAFQALLDSLYAQLLAGVAEGRGRSVDEVRAWIDRPTLTPVVALERGMVDAVVYPDAMRAHVHQVGEADWLQRLEAPVKDDEEPRLTSIREYVKAVRAEERSRGDKIAVIHAEGSIVSGDPGPSLFGGTDVLTDAQYQRWMKEVRDDPRVKAVVVRVNSPGGSALAASLMWRENARTQAAGKPIVISMGDYAASGGYLMSANADWIVSEPGTLTGSIGVFAGKFDLSGTYQKLGIGVHTFRRGEMADLLSFSSGFDPAQRVVFREYLEDFYAQFLRMVAEGRRMTVDEAHERAQGRVWTGEQALELGLVDELGTLDAAIAKAAGLAGVERWTLLNLPRRRTFFEVLMEDVRSGEADVKVTLPVELDAAALQELAVLEAIGRDGGIGALLPGRPTVR